MAKTPAYDFKSLWTAMTKKPTITIAGEVVDLSEIPEFGRISLKKDYLPNETLTDDMIKYYNNFPAIFGETANKAYLEIFLRGLKYRYKEIASKLSVNYKEQGPTPSVRQMTSHEQELGDLIRKVEGVLRALNTPAKLTEKTKKITEENDIKALIRKFAMLILRSTPTPAQEKILKELRTMEENVGFDSKTSENPTLEQLLLLGKNGDVYKQLLGTIPNDLVEKTKGTTSREKILEIIKEAQLRVTASEGELTKQALAAKAAQKNLEDAEARAAVALVKAEAAELAKVELERKHAAENIEINQAADSLRSFHATELARIAKETKGTLEQAHTAKLAHVTQEAEAVRVAQAAETARAAHEAEVARQHAEELQRQSEEAKMHLETVQAELKHITEQLREAHATISNLEEAAREREIAIEAATKQSSEKLAQTEATLKEAKNRNVASQAALQAARATLERAEAALDAAKKQGVETTTQTAAVEQTTAAVQAAGIQADVAGVNMNIQTEETSKTAAAAAAELEVLRQKLLASKDKQLDEVRSKAANEIAALTTELAELKQSKSAENQEQIKKLTDNLSTLQYRFNTLTTSSAELAATIRQQSAKTIEAAQSNAAAKIAAAEAAAAAADTALQTKSVEDQAQLDALTAAKAELETISTINKQKLNMITEYATKILKGEQVEILASINAPVKEMLEKFGSKSGDVCVLAYFVNYFYSTLRPSKEFMKKIDDITANTTDLYKVLIEIEPALLLANKVQYSYAGIYEIQQNTDEFTTIFSKALSIDPKQAKAIVRTRIDSYDNIIEIISDNGRVLLLNKLLDNKMPTKFFTYSNGILQNTTPIEIPKSGTISYDVLFLIFLSVSKKYVNKILTEDPLKCMTVRSEIIENKCIPIFIKENSNGIRLSAHTIETLSKPPFCFKTSGFQEMKSDKEYNIVDILSEMNILLKKFSSNCKLNEKFPIPPGFAINYSMPPVFKTLPQYNDGEKIGAKLSTVGDLIEVSYYTCPSKRGGGTKKRTKHAKNFTQKKR